MLEIPQPLFDIDDILDEATKASSANVVWAPQPGSQMKFLSCPVWEVLYHGTRGPGKTDALIMDFAQDCGKGYGAAWQGILFRRTFPELHEVIKKTKKWFQAIFPGATYNASDHIWTWPDGEQLLLRYIRSTSDYWNYHGHEYPWIGWEELCTWHDLEVYHMMKACNRSSDPDVPRKYRATANPYGPGHQEVKAYFIDVAGDGEVYTDPETGKERCHIKGFLLENAALLRADPDYVNTLLSMCKDDKNLRDAWLKGSWDIIAGGALADVWNPDVHVIKPFPIPASWRVDRSFDWGASKPYAVGFWACSDGTSFLDADGNERWVPKGTLFLIGELYGWGGKPNKGTRELPGVIAANVLGWQKDFRVALYSAYGKIGRKRFKYSNRENYRASSKLTIANLQPGKVMPGPADPSIFDTSTGESIAEKMSRSGVAWLRGDASPGSRVAGLETVRSRLAASLQHPMEEPGMFVFGTCRHWIRTVPVLPRDEKKLDDVDTNAEDHHYDQTRYRLERKSFKTESVGV